MEHERAYLVSVCSEQVHFLSGPLRSAIYEILPLALHTLLCYLENGQRLVSNIYHLYIFGKRFKPKTEIRDISKDTDMQMC